MYNEWGEKFPDILQLPDRKLNSISSRNAHISSRSAGEILKDEMADISWWPFCFNEPFHLDSP